MNNARPPAIPGLHDILWGTLIAAATLLAADSFLTGLFTPQSIWKPSWVLAAIFMRKVVLHWPAVFDFGAISAALTALYIVSFGYVALLAWLILPWNWNRAVLAGGIWGLACYFVNFYLVTAWIPWLTSERNWIALVSHVLLGIVAAEALVRRCRRDST